MNDYAYPLDIIEAAEAASAEIMASLNIEEMHYEPIMKALVAEREKRVELAHAVNAIFQERGPETPEEFALCELVDAALLPL